MKLTYRGVQYDYTPQTLEVTESEIVGKYRGQAMHFQYPRHVPQPLTVHELRYRGVPYRTDGSRVTEAFPAVGPIPDAIDAAIRARSVADMRQALLGEVARVHRQNIYRSLRHRIEVAKAQGNELLLRQLEAEMHQTV